MSQAPQCSVSIVIPTKNRRQALDRLLNSLTGCSVSAPLQVEVIVVDNGSTDRTRATVEACAQRAPFPVRYIREDRSGASTARNTGVFAATGRIVAFTDDDCAAEPAWFEAIHQAFSQSPDAGGIFGRVLPETDQKVDVSTFSVKLEREPKSYRFPCWPFIGHGNNMAFRRQLLLDCGGFDAAYGPGAPLKASEDLELAYRLLRQGVLLRYEPSVTVRHFPQKADEAMWTAHKHYAIGFGACMAKNALRGDFYALKTAWWWWCGMWQGYWKAVREGQALARKIKGVYLRWIFVGIAMRLAHDCGLMKANRT